MPASFPGPPRPIPLSTCWPRRNPSSRQARLTAVALLVASGASHAAYVCTVTPQRVNLITQNGATASVRQSLSVSCSRALSDASTLTYRVTASDGLNPQGNNRRARSGATSNFIGYRLIRATSLGAAANCAAGSNWADTGSSFITGTLDFGTGIGASQAWEYCTNANSAALLPAGLYTDSVLLTLRYPNTGAGQLVTAPLDLQFGVQTACLLDQPIASLSIHYTSMQVAPSTVSTPVLIRCSQDTPWTVGLLNTAAPAATPVGLLSGQQLLGLNYSLEVTPAAGTGQGNTGSGQALNLELRVPGGQSGTCATGNCNASAVHTLVLSF